MNVTEPMWARYSSTHEPRPTRSTTSVGGCLLFQKASREGWVCEARCELPCTVQPAEKVNYTRSLTTTSRSPTNTTAVAVFSPHCLASLQKLPGHHVITEPKPYGSHVKTRQHAGKKKTRIKNKNYACTYNTAASAISPYLPNGKQKNRKTSPRTGTIARTIGEGQIGSKAFRSFSPPQIAPPPLFARTTVYSHPMDSRRTRSTSSSSLG